jgi:hypothetical protein
MTGKNQNPIILIEATIIENTAALASILAETRQYFSAPRLTQPPIPDNVMSFVPCKLLVTELEGEEEKRLGRIQFLRLDETSLYDQEWTIDEG